MDRRERGSLTHYFRNLEDLAIKIFDEEIERPIVADFVFEVEALDPHEDLIEAIAIEADVTLAIVVPEASSGDNVDLDVFSQLVPESVISSASNRCAAQISGQIQRVNASGSQRLFVVVVIVQGNVCCIEVEQSGIELARADEVRHHNGVHFWRTTEKHPHRSTIGRQ